MLKVSEEKSYIEYLSHCVVHNTKPRATKIVILYLDNNQLGLAEKLLCLVFHKNITGAQHLPFSTDTLIYKDYRHSVAYLGAEHH